MLFIPAFVGFDYPMGSRFWDNIWEGVCLTVGFMGLAIRILTVGYAPKNTSGRNTRNQLAATLNTSGMYSLVRNPLYLGNFFMWLAPVLFPRCWWLCLIYVMAFCLYYERIVITEENFLRRKFGREYLQWCARTPAFFPWKWKWQKPSLSFSWKTAIRREYHGFYALIVVLFALEHVSEACVHDAFTWDKPWIYLFCAGTLIYCFVRFLAKRTNALCVEGR